LSQGSKDLEVLEGLEHLEGLEALESLPLPFLPSGLGILELLENQWGLGVLEDTGNRYSNSSLPPVLELLEQLIKGLVH
jgi:hypothetical protein